jgi:hypothetical protein
MIGFSGILLLLCYYEILLVYIHGGWSSSILKILSQLISDDYKAWAIAQAGYVLGWLWHAKNKGPVYLGPVSSVLASNKTAATVLFLLDSLPKGLGFRYVVWLDNLFVSTKLLRHLQDHDYGAVGTCRTNSGICKAFGNLKNKDKKEDFIPWGTIF